MKDEIIIEVLSNLTEYTRQVIDKRTDKDPYKRNRFAEDCLLQPRQLNTFMHGAAGLNSKSLEQIGKTLKL